MSERVYLESSEVVVTNARFVVGKQTYAVRNITSVRYDKIEPSWGVYVLALVIIVIALGAWKEGGKEAGIILGGVGLAVGVLAAFRSPTYALVLTTNAGEMRALHRKRLNEIREVNEALNAAIVG